MAIISIEKHRYWPTGNHKFQTDHVASTTRINDYYTEILLKHSPKRMVVAMNKVKLDNLFISLALREGEPQCAEQPQNKSTTSNETSIDSPKMRRVYRRRTPAN